MTNFHKIWNVKLRLDLSPYRDSLRAERSGDRIPVGGEIFHTRPDRPWGALSLLYNKYQVFPEDNSAGALTTQPI